MALGRQDGTLFCAINASSAANEEMIFSCATGMPSSVVWGAVFLPRRRLDLAPFHSRLQFSRRACRARCEKKADVWRLSIAFAGPLHLLAAGEPRREIGNRPRIDVGLVPFLDDGEIGRSWSPGAATLPAIAPKEIGSRGQYVGPVINEITAAGAVEIDREFKIGRRHELGLADFAGPGAARAGRQVAALNEPQGVHEFRLEHIGAAAVKGKRRQRA